MGESRLNLVLGVNNSSFNSGLRASSKEVNNTRESISTLGAVGQKSFELLGKFTQFYFKTFLEARSDMVLHKFTGDFIPLISVMLKVKNAAVNMWSGLKEKTHEAHAAMEQLIASYQNDPFIAAAGRAQAYRSQLVALTKSTKLADEQLRYMYDYAAQTPFEMNGIIEAGIQLKSFGQSISEFLPLATTLAAVAGTDVPSAATTLGKALSGVSEGFTSLQDTFRLTRKELQQNGAIMENGSILTKTLIQQEKAAASIKKAAEFKFGNIVKDQVNTIEGAFSNLHDMFNQLTTEIGKPFQDMIIKNVQAVAELVGQFKKLTPVIGAGVKAFTDIFGYLTSGVWIVTKLANTVEWTGETIVHLAKKMDDLGGSISPVLGGIGSTILALTSMNAIAGAVTVGVVGLIGSAVLGGIATGFLLKGVGSLAVALAELLPAGSAAAVGLGNFGAASIAAGASARATAITIATSFGPAIVAIAVFTAAAIVMRQELDRNLDTAIDYANQVDTLTSGLTKNKDVYDKHGDTVKKVGTVYGKSAEELKSFGKTAEDISWVILGLRQDNEELAKSATDESKAAIKANNEKIKSLTEVRGAMARLEQVSKDSGKALLDDVKENEQKKYQFERNRAKHLYETKEQEANAMEKIFKANLKHIKLLEEEEKRAADAPDAKTEKGKQRIEDLKKVIAAANQINKDYEIEIIDTRRDSVAEQIGLRQEAMNIDIQMGKKSKADQIRDLQDILKSYKLTAEERRDIQNKIKINTLQNDREIKESQLSTLAASKEGIENLMDANTREASLAIDRVKNEKEETARIEEKYKIEKKLIEEKLAMDNEIEGEQKKKDENNKKAEAELSSLLYRTSVLKKDTYIKYRGYDADELQRTQALISSQKSLLQAKLDVLDVADRKGAVGHEEDVLKIRRAIRTKEIDEIRAEEKIAIIRAGRNAEEVEKAKIEAKAKLKLVQLNSDKEDLERQINDEMQSAQRLVDKKSIAEAKLANKKLEFDMRVAAGQESLVGIYEKEEDLQKQSLKLKLESLNADEKSQLVGKLGIDAENIKLKFAQERKKANLEGEKLLHEARLREASANADLKERELADKKEAFDMQREMGIVSSDQALKEKNLVTETLRAKLAGIKAHLEEQKASGDAKDISRAEADARIQSQKAIRESVKALKDLNDAQKPVTSEADKLQKKYDKILDDIQKAHDILNEADKKPEEEAPSAEELRNNPGARIDYEARLRIKEMRDAPNAKTDAAKEKSREVKADLIKANNEAKFKAAQDLMKEMKAKGATPQEIKDAVYKQNQEMDNAVGAGAQKSAGANISNPKANETTVTSTSAIAPPEALSTPGSTVGADKKDSKTKTTSTATTNTSSTGVGVGVNGSGESGGAVGNLSETNSILREMLGVLKGGKSAQTAQTAKTTSEPVRPKLRNSNEAYQYAQLPPKTDWRGKRLDEMNDSERFALAPAPHPGYQT